MEPAHLVGEHFDEVPYGLPQKLALQCADSDDRGFEDVVQAHHAKPVVIPLVEREIGADGNTHASLDIAFDGLGVVQCQYNVPSHSLVSQFLLYPLPS